MLCRTRRRGSFRSLRVYALGWLAEPQLAQRAKAGGARRSRTADLLNAIQALSQLSYGPFRDQISGVSNQEYGNQEAASDNATIPDP
jgi:hypothetical protein